MATKRIDSPGPSKVTSEILDRQPPRSLEAEQALLGSILQLPEVCDDVAVLVRVEDFYDDANRRLFRHLRSMHDDGKRIDLTLLVDRLKSAGEYEAVGGAAYLAEVIQAAPTAAHAVHYAEIVQHRATLRSLIGASTEILRDAYDESVDPREMLGRAEQRIFSILEQRGTGQVQQMQQILNDALARLDAKMKGTHGIGGTETGYAELDAMTGGLHNGELVILAARPSMGKTALALNIAEHVTLRAGVPVLFVSLEMSSIELADRMLCSLAQVNGQRLRNGTISKDDCIRISERAAELSQAPLFVDDTPSRTMTEIAAAARRLKRKGGLGLVVIDYLQLIEPDNPRDPRQEQVARIARRLKGLAREVVVPVLCLAQLNRQTEASKENIPRLSHLRESGAIEQDADVVMFVHREDYYGTSEDDDKPRDVVPAEIHVAKQRNGPTGVARLAFHRAYTRFVNASQRAYDEFEAVNF